MTAAVFTLTVLVALHGRNCGGLFPSKTKDADWRIVLQPHTGSAPDRQVRTFLIHSTAYIRLKFKGDVSQEASELQQE
jgi:hypothetical protein